MKVMLGFIGVLIASACAPMSEERLEARQYRQVDWESRYVNYARRCSHAGGRMIVRASHRIGRAGIPRRGDYYNCTLNIGTVPK